jgi:hypothetical protein
MQLRIAGQTVRCAVCGSESFARRYFYAFGKGVSLSRKPGLAFGVNSRRQPRHYACDRCSWTIVFAGDSPEAPQQQGD